MAQQSSTAFEPLINRAPADAIVCMSMERLASGFEDIRAELELQQRRCAQYAVDIEELTHSTIYKAGNLVTLPLRKSKALLQRLLRKV